jgi:hypothetical protein
MKSSIQELAVRSVVREKPPELSVVQAAHWAQQGLSAAEIGQQYGVSADSVYRLLKKHPSYFEVVRVQRERRRALLAQAEYTYWKRAAVIMNRGFPVERAHLGESRYLRDYGDAKTFERSLKKALRKHPDLTIAV